MKQPTTQQTHKWSANQPIEHPPKANNYMNNKQTKYSSNSATKQSNTISNNEPNQESIEQCIEQQNKQLSNQSTKLHNQPINHADKQTI